MFWLLASIQVHPKAVQLRNICMFNAPPNWAHCPRSRALKTRLQNNVWQLQLPSSEENLRFSSYSSEIHANIFDSPGYFNGTYFEAVDGAMRIANFGKDSYAGQFFYNIPESEEQIFIVWSSNWEYARQVLTGELEGWRSVMVCTISLSM
jgi:sucrose-6-phosphate hydrolase SacC (GH32 family)